MSDVLKTAITYRQRLQAELNKLEEFLRMAEELSKDKGIEMRLTVLNDSARATSTEPLATSRPRHSVAAV